tara:strand:- start:1175 stop:1561 length:387 start_codon:yes stop_codon:yes gene_type:complete
MSQVVTQNNESTVQYRTYEEVVREVAIQAMRNNADKFEVSEVEFYPNNDSKAFGNELNETAFYAIEVTVESHTFKGYNSLTITGRMLAELIARMQELGLELVSIRQFQNKKWVKESKITLHFFSMDGE